LGFNKEEQMKLYDIVKTHDWLEKVCMGDETFVEKAFELKRGNLFELARIFTQADLKSIDGKGSYFSQFSPQLDEKTQQMRAQIAIFKKTQPFLPVSKFPKASELKDANGVLTWDKNGVQNRVIDLNAISNFEQAGFEKGTTAENLKILIHAINMNAEQSLGSLDYLSSLDNGALISTSYLMDPTHDFQTFMSFGFVLNVDTGNIHAGKDEDFASGINKDIKNKILTREDFARGDYADRNYFPKLFKESMQLSDEEYADFIEKYSNMTLAQIEKQDPDVARKINEVLKNANNEKIKKGKSYNEILVTRPEIQAVFVRKNESNSMPLFLRKYAQEHDIPVVLLGN
jgi:hypothetical protein